MSVQPCILVVDDNPENLDVLLDVLDSSHFDVRVAKDGKTALDIVAANPPDLILLDVMMPEMNGFEVCSRLKADKQTRDIPVVFLTVLNETVNKIRGYELGGVDYITKPIQITEVMIRIQTQLTLNRLRKQEKHVKMLEEHFSNMVVQSLCPALNTISGMIQYLKQFGERLTDDEKQKKYDMINKSILKMTSILDNIFVYKKSVEHHIGFYPKRTDIKQLCKTALSEFTSVVQKSHEIILSATDDEIFAVVDPDLVWHILIQLLTNAVNYSPPGTKIDIKIYNQDTNIVFHIQDQGIGIPKSDQQRIFDAYVRGGNIGRIKGSGLGLTIVKQFVDLHHGKIELESDQGKGCLIKVFLPKEQIV